ncbi:MAG: glycosyltransferase family 2 protein, partial [Candidatus Eisenbacteria sp.]|nr:glycosyltransferase family 2 protein [Candidatus Eisenbacteria bacterium]
MNSLTDTTGRPTLSIVVPLCNEEGNVTLLLEKLRDAVQTLGVPYEVILVDDGSSDATWSIVSEAVAKDDRLKGLSLSRNLGHESAMFAGLYHSSGDAVVTMDGDLQHPPSVVPELFRAWQQGSKVVETQR